MASSDYESDSFSNNTKPSPPQKGTSLQPAEIEILDAELESWKNANQNKKSSIMLTLRNKIKNLDANVMLKMHEWVWKKKALIKYGGGWTLRKVVMHCQKKSINKVLEKARIKQGSAEMIKSYQKAIDTVMKSLTAKEIQEAEALVIEWNEQQPPWDVQSETTEKKGHKYAEEFDKEMWKQCGSRVVVMAAWEDADGEVIVGVHDFNNELGNGKLFEELDKCQDKFAKYAQMAFGNGSTNAELPDKDATPWSRQRKSNGKPKTILPGRAEPTYPGWVDSNLGMVARVKRAASQQYIWLREVERCWRVPPNASGRGQQQWSMDGVGGSSDSKQQYYLMGDKVVGSDSDDESNLYGNDGRGTSMVDEDAAEAVASLDYPQQIARCQVAEGNTCQPIAIGKEPPNAGQHVVGSNTSTAQPMPEGHHTDLPDSVQLADPLVVPTTIKSAHKQENSKHKFPIPSMSQYSCPCP
ncbi:hypothetical protein F5J12DRAFT_784057 [Pisolithus orientalis]|uniref:uncharacterized protein n=1 Tax=Pisolithus orientalis TaxID=936130 RepID=UPI00222537DB|nr:uncharacterized protein F5J12DRAFT_784057 [Pisolithus orientalis]KAI6002339.1 hypothetical protein F5J12DRAFT_784057 [Pisolithus orientalis]